MPTYEYACRSCGHHLEIVQSFSDDPLTDCPACAESALRKVFSPIGITFKGSGFYKTDSRSSSKKDTAAASASKDSTKDSGAAKGSGSTKKDSAGSTGSSSSGESTSTTSTKSAKSA